MDKYTVYVYSILIRKGWHFSSKFDTFAHLYLFFKFHKMQYFDDRLKQRLYKVHDNFKNEDTYFLLDYNKDKHKSNKFHVIGLSDAIEYIEEVL